jgi:dTDP-4-amino-4,6-dideoxygalactose transaminase
MHKSTVRFLALEIDDEARMHRLLGAVERVLRHGRLVLGPEVEEFERRLAERCGRQFAVALNSGSTALWLGLKSLSIGPGDEVITTSLSWIATANAIALTGATPVFADINEDLNIDPESVRSLVSDRTKALLPVHYTGKMCDMAAIEQIARAHGLVIVEDAAQAFDATRDGRRAGGSGTVGCFSMNAMKVYAACGDAGAVVTDDAGVAERLRRLRYNGTINREECVETALNGRIDPLQAAILLERLDDVAEIVARRQQVADWYTERLRGLVETPPATVGGRDVWYTYQIRVARRDELKAFLEARGIEARIQHPILMPDQPIYRHCRADTSKAKRIVREILCLPSTQRMTLSDVEYVCACVEDFHQREPARAARSTEH